MRRIILEGRLMRRFFFEHRIMGMNALYVFSALTLVMLLAACFGGELLNLSIIGFEMIFPFITAVAVGEWGKTRADANFDIVAAQSRSLFPWVAARFWAPFLTAGIFAFGNMLIVFFIRQEMSIGEMLLLYFPPAFFLSTLCALCGICFTEEHVATMLTGSFWLVSMLARALLRIPAVQYIYLFIRFAGDTNGIWLINKITLILVGLGLWGVIYFSQSRQSVLPRLRHFARSSR